MRTASDEPRPRFRGDYEGDRAAFLMRRRIVRTLRTSVLTALVTMLVLLGLRFLVLVLEAYTMVSNERSADDELVLLCRDGAAQSSVHMRHACMEAEVDRASPAFVRAVTRGAYNLGAELGSMAAYPLQSSAMTGVMVMSVLPWIGTIRSLFVGGGDRHRNRAGDAEHTVFILHNGDRADVGDSLRRRIGGGGSGSIRVSSPTRSSPRLLELGSESGNAAELGAGSAWEDLDLGSAWDRKRR